MSNKHKYIIRKILLEPLSPCGVEGSSDPELENIENCELVGVSFPK